MKYLIIFWAFSTPFLLAGQSKKEVINNKIKSSTVTITTYDKGEQNTRKESYEEYDKWGNCILKVDYAKDGSVKSKETALYDSYGNKIEESRYNAKDNDFERKVYKYNAKRDKTEESEFNESGELLKRTTFTYALNGNKTAEIVTDKAGNVIKKVEFTYNPKNLKSEKQTFSKTNTLESVKKWSYTYF